MSLWQEWTETFLDTEEAQSTDLFLVLLFLDTKPLPKTPQSGGNTGCYTLCREHGAE